MIPSYNRKGRKDQQIKTKIKTKSYKAKLSRLVSAVPFSLRPLPVLSPLLLLILLSLTLSGCNLFNSQFGTLEGVVHRQIGDGNFTTPLPDVLISISGSTNTAYTDRNGYFLLNEAPSGKRTLTVIKEGYVIKKLLNVYIEPNTVNQVHFGDPIVLIPKEDTALYDAAYKFLEQKEYQQALNTFQELLADYPDSPWADDAQYHIGYIYELNGLYITARDEYSILLFHYPDSPWAAFARLGIGNCYYRTGDCVNAISEFRKVIDDYPLCDITPLAQYRIALCNRELGYYNEAIAGFQRVIDLYPDSTYTPASQYFIGEIYCKDLTSYDEALLAFQNAVNNYPSAKWPDDNNRLIAPCAYFYIGYCYEMKAMWQEALDTYQIIVDQYPNSTCWGESTQMGALAQERIDRIINEHFPPEP